MSLPSREECCYTSHYCEENVWKLCQYVRDSAPRDLDQFYVVFISNPEQKIPLWKQKAGVEEEDFLVLWDYHVVSIHKSLPSETVTGCEEHFLPSSTSVVAGDSPSPLVYDLDSVLPFPCPFSQYWQQGIRSDALLLPKFRRHFRVIAAAEFLQTFASDRSRMRDPLDGSWIKPPPHYPCICTPLSTNNLDSFICMSNDSCFAMGTILHSSESLREYFVAEQEVLPATKQFSEESS